MNIMSVSPKVAINPELKGYLKVRYDNSGSPINRSLIGDQESFEKKKKIVDT